PRRAAPLALHRRGLWRATALRGQASRRRTPDACRRHQRYLDDVCAVALPNTSALWAAFCAVDDPAHTNEQGSLQQGLVTVYPIAMADTKPITTIDAYLQSFPKDTRTLLENVRQAIHRAAPDAVETMSYGIPTFDRNRKHLVFFAGWRRHVSLYPLPAGDNAFQHDIAPYKAKGSRTKSTLHFPLDKPIPYDLVERVVRFLVLET